MKALPKNEVRIARQESEDGLERSIEDVPFVHPTGRSKTASSVQKAVPADGHGCIAARRCCARRGRGGWDEARQIAAYHSLGLDDRLAAEHNVLGADQVCLAGDLVAGILECFALAWGQDQGSVTGSYRSTHRLDILSFGRSTRHCCDR